MPATISMHEDGMSNQRLHVQWPSPHASHLNSQSDPSQATYGNPQAQSTVPDYGNQAYQSNLSDGMNPASIHAEAMLTAARLQLPKSQLRGRFSSHFHEQIHKQKTNA